MASISSNKRKNRATLATSNNIYLPTPYTSPPLQRQCLSDSLQSFNPSHGSGSSSWMLWGDPNSPAYYQGENKSRLCGVLLAVVVFLVIVAVLAIAGLAVYMGALRIDTGSNRNNTKQQKLIKDDRSLEIRNGVLRKVSSNQNLTTPHTIHLKKINDSEAEPVEDLPVIEGSFKKSNTELSKGENSTENVTEINSAILAAKIPPSSGKAGVQAKNVTVDDLYVVGGVMEVKENEENDGNVTKPSNFERHQSGNILESSTPLNAVTVVREANTRAAERESEERSYSQSGQMKTNSSASVETGSTSTVLVLEQLPTQIIQEKDQTVLQVSGAKIERLGIHKHENKTNVLTSSSELPSSFTQRTPVTSSQEHAAPSTANDQLSRGIVSALPKIKPKTKIDPGGVPDTSAVRSLSNDTTSTSNSDEATFQTRFPPRQRVTVLPSQSNSSNNVSVKVDSKNAYTIASEGEESADLDPNSMLRRMGPIHPAPEQDVGKGTPIRYSDPSQGDRGNAMVLNPAGPMGQNNPMNPTVLSTNTYKDRYQHLSAGSKIRPHYGTKIVEAQVRDTNPSKEDMKHDKNNKNSDQQVDGGEMATTSKLAPASAAAPAPAAAPTLAPAPVQDSGSRVEEGWRPMVPADFEIAAHRPDMDQHEHTPVSQSSDHLSRVHLQASNANQGMPSTVLNANVNGSVSFSRNNSSSSDRPGTLLTSQGNANERNISRSNAAEVIRKIIADSNNWPELPIMQQFSNLGNFLRKDDKTNESPPPHTTNKVISSTTAKPPKTSTPLRAEPEEEFENHGIALPIESLPAELLIEEQFSTAGVTKDPEIVVATLKPPKSNSGIGRPLRPRPTLKITSTSTTTTTAATTETLLLSTTAAPRKSPPKAQQRPSVYSITTTKTSKITTPLKSAVRSNRTKTTSTRPELGSSTPLEVVTRKSVHVSFSDDKTKKDDRRNETTHYVKINVRQENKVVPSRSNGVGSHNAYHILPPKTVTTRPKPKGPARITSSNGTIRISTVPPKRRNGTSSTAKPISVRKENVAPAAVVTHKNNPINIASKLTETNFYPVTYFPLLMNSTKHVGESHRHPKMTRFNYTNGSSSSSLEATRPVVKSHDIDDVSDKQVSGGTEIRMSLEDIVRNYRTKITSSQNSKSDRNYSITYDGLQEKQNLNTQDTESAATEVSEVRHQHKASANMSGPLPNGDHDLLEPTQNTPKVIVSASSRVQDRTVETKHSVAPAHYVVAITNNEGKPADLGTSKLFQNYPKIIQSFSPGMQNSAIGIRNLTSEKYVSKFTTHLPFTATTKVLPNYNIQRTNQTPIENRFAESFHSSYKENTKYNPTTQEKILSTHEINKPSHRENDKDMNYEAFKDTSFPLEDAIVNAISKFATVHVSAVVKNTSLGMFNSQNVNADIATNNVTDGSINMTASNPNKLNITGQKEWSKVNSTWLPGNLKKNSSELGEKLPPHFTLNQNGIPILTKTYTKATDSHLPKINNTQDDMKITESSKNKTECTGIVCGDNECVAMQSRCNQLVDCSDGADEKDCTCADYLKAQYLTRKLCDGVVDCWDFTDENNCEWCSPGQFVCPNSQMCIDREKLCDGNRDCPYGDDEKQCVTIAPTLGNATDFPYHQEGYLMVRKQGKWGKLCLQNFNSVVSDSHTTWEVKDLGKAVCKAMTFSDFDRVERMVDTTGRSDEDSLYYELSYSPEETNASTARSSLTFHESPCAQKEVVHVKCRDLECGIRPQAVSQWARSRRSRIVGGGNSGPGSWPWQAALYKEGEFQCGATLISEQWLVSAGHCFYHALDDYWVARLGTLRRGTNFPSPYEQLRPISNIILHPRYVDSGFINDISLLRMKEPVAFSDYVRPICLPQPNSMLKDGKLCTVVGWGQLFEVGRIFPDTLQEVQLPIISTGECRKRTLFLPLYRVTDNMFCAGFDRGGRDACLGDSGGPLMCQEADGHWSLYGVTSNGYGCARANRPGVYTKVAKYVVWIRTSMNLLMQLRESKAACKGHRCPLGECLPRSRVCNGYMECSDGSDEKDCW